jgi:23S rRNA maturation mini-RNase III
MSLDGGHLKRHANAHVRNVAIRTVQDLLFESIAKTLAKIVDKMERRGRNSQHPKKPCAVGWDLYNKELK